MIQTNYEFKQPSDNTVIWRYTKIDYLKDMFNNHGLRFTNVKYMNDGEEGFFPKLYGDLSTLADVSEERRTKVSESLLKRIEFQKPYRKRIHLNCWSMARYETKRMWELYGKDGVAIKTTYKRLLESMIDPKYLNIGIVEYVDYNTYEIDDSHGSSLYQTYLIKKKEIWEDETELRAIYTDNSGKRLEKIEIEGKEFYGDIVPPECPEIPDHAYVACNFSKLIKVLYMNPLADKGDWDAVRMLRNHFKNPFQFILLSLLK